VHFKRGKTYSFVAIFSKMLLSELVKLFLISKEAQRGGEKKTSWEKKVNQIIISVAEVKLISLFNRSCPFKNIFYLILLITFYFQPI